MSDDEVDEDLLALLAQSLGIDNESPPQPPKTRVLEDAEFVYDNSTDVAIDMQGTKAAAASIWSLIREKEYSIRDWSKHELHPKVRDESTVDFIFLMDLLNFSFWSEAAHPEERFAIEYRGKKWTGYWSLVAAIQRALDEGIPITSPTFWVDEVECTDAILEHVFRSCTSEKMPLLYERIYCMREAGYILQERFNSSFATCIFQAKASAPALVNLLVDSFPCFDDMHPFEDASIRFHKRAQILTADLWACFQGESYGTFNDIDQITMFADYRIPQMLHALSCLQYSPPLASHIFAFKSIPSGHPWEIQLRGCSIWCIELVKREIQLQHPESDISAVLIDFFLYDTVKEMEKIGLLVGAVPHHRTRCIWY